MTEEEAFVRSFIVAKKRARWIELLANPKTRAKLTRTLAHFRDLDPPWMVALPRGQDGPGPVERELRARGAGDTCHLISESAELDGKRLPLRCILARPRAD